MDANALLWTAGIVACLPLLAMKFGAGLVQGDVRQTRFRIACALYFAGFIGTARLTAAWPDLTQRIMLGNPWLCGIVGVGLIAWGILAIRWLVPVARQSPPQTTAWILALPCPVWLVVTAVSTRLAGQLTHLPVLHVGSGLALAFLALGWATRRFLGATRTNPRAQASQTAMALALCVLGVYFLAATFLPGVMRDAAQVYASFLVDGAELGTEHGVWVWLMLAAVAAVGYFARRRSEMRS